MEGRGVAVWGLPQQVGVYDKECGPKWLIGGSILNLGNFIGSDR